MANTFTNQTILDGDRNVFLKLTGILDTSNQSLTTVVSVANLAPPCTALRIDEVEYSISNQLGVQLLWDAATDDVALALYGMGEMCFQDVGGLQNPRSAGVTGNILIQTTGWASGTQIYSITLKMVKQGVTS